MYYNISQDERNRRSTSGVLSLSVYMKFYAYTNHGIKYTCVINNITNSHIKNKEKFYNINTRIYMKLNFFLLNYEIGSFIGNLKNNRHM